MSLVCGAYFLEPSSARPAPSSTMLFASCWPSWVGRKYLSCMSGLRKYMVIRFAANAVRPAPARRAGMKGGQQGCAECSFCAGDELAESCCVQLGDCGNTGCRHLLQEGVGAFVCLELLDACVEDECAGGDAQCCVGELAHCCVLLFCSWLVRFLLNGFYSRPGFSPCKVLHVKFLNIF